MDKQIEFKTRDEFLKFNFSEGIIRFECKKCTNNFVKSGGCKENAPFDVIFVKEYLNSNGYYLCECGNIIDLSNNQKYYRSSFF